MANTPNLGLNNQTTGSDNGTWGVVLNNNQSIIDSRLGARLAKDVSGAVDITVSPTEAQNFIMNLSGVLTGNIKYIIPAQGGEYFIKNGTTGAFTLTVVNDAAGTGVVLPQSTGQLLISNPDNTTVYSILPASLASLVVDSLTVTTTLSIPASSIITAALAANAITTAKINDGAVTEAKITLADNTTGNVTSTAHGFAPKSSADATRFLNSAATPAYAAVKDSDLSLTDITTNNVSISKHGFTPKLPNDSTQFLNGVGSWVTPSTFTATAGKVILGTQTFQWGTYTGGLGSATLSFPTPFSGTATFVGVTTVLTGARVTTVDTITSTGFNWLTQLTSSGATNYAPFNWFAIGPT